MNRRDFLQSLLCTTAVAAVDPAALAAPRLFPGELGVYEGIRFVEGGVTRNQGWAHFADVVERMPVAVYRESPIKALYSEFDDSYLAVSPRPAIEDWR